MDFSTTPIETLLEYQLALANAVVALGMIKGIDTHQTVATLTKLIDKITEALKDEQFEIDSRKES
jgi:hypothetical protein